MAESFEDTLRQQKEQCVFCKIISGEIPSEKVYDDDQVIAIMDVNPAAEGHILLMPKEHYMIMPMVPRDIADSLAKMCKYLIRAQEDSIGSDYSSIFIANGGIAGQQSTHFMMHIVPRYTGDSLTNLNCVGTYNEKDQEIAHVLGPNLVAVMHELGQKSEISRQFVKRPSETQDQKVTDSGAKEQQVAPPKKTPSEDQKKKISQYYNDNPEFKDLLLNRTDVLKDKIKTEAEWGALFSGIDVDALVEKLKEMENARR